MITGLTKGITLDWIMQTTAWFTYASFDKELGVGTPEGKATRRVIFGRLVLEGILEKHPYKEGTYRRIDKTVDEIKWQDLTDTSTLDIKYPLGLETFVTTYPKSPIVVAAPPGWGKTAFLMNVALLNMDYPKGVFIWSNDLTDVEIFERLNNSGVEIPNPAPFKIFERIAHFADVIKTNPDAIHIVDYLDLNQDLFMVGKEIDDIYQALGRGVAFIGLQKNPFQKDNPYGYGGVFSAKRAKLYLSITTVKEAGQTYNTLTIVKARGWADKGFNPNGQQFKFKIRQGIQIIRLDADEEEPQEEVALE